MAHIDKPEQPQLHIHQIELAIVNGMSSSRRVGSTTIRLPEKSKIKDIQFVNDEHLAVAMSGTGEPLHPLMPRSRLEEMLTCLYQKRLCS